MGQGGRDPEADLPTIWDIDHAELWEIIQELAGEDEAAQRQHLNSTVPVTRASRRGGGALRLLPPLPA